MIKGKSEMILNNVQYYLSQAHTKHANRKHSRLAAVFGDICSVARQGHTTSEVVHGY